MLGLLTGEKRQRLEEGSDSDDGHLSKQPVHHEHLSSDSDSESYGTSNVCGRSFKRKGRSGVNISSLKSFKIFDDHRRRITQESMQ